MGKRFGALATFLVILAVGALLGSGLAQWFSPSPSAGFVSDADSLGRVRVEVRNAGGRGGMARAATDRLRDLGFDVVYFGNADRFDQDSTVVVDRVGDVDKARAVAEALGAHRVVSEPDSNLYLDVTVLLGSTWEAPVAADPGAEDGRPWWDVGHWFNRREAEEPANRNEG
jgi:hypothetical protein